MLFRAASAAVTIGLIACAWITAPAASAATSPIPAAISATPSHLCVIKAGSVYGCAMSNGNLRAVTLDSPGTSNLTNFFYDSSTGQIVQSNTLECLEYNASSTTYPVRMDTCVSGRSSQYWYKGPNPNGLQLQNLGATLNDNVAECLEGSEVIGFGKPLTMAKCSDNYNGENWYN
jgi:hypothetical protein